MCEACDNLSPFDTDLASLIGDDPLIKPDTDFYYALKDSDIDLDSRVTYPPLAQEEDLIEYD